MFVIMRGRKMDVERTIDDLNGKYLPFDHKSAGKGVLNVMANPVQLVEIIFPKEHLDCMVNTLGGEKGLQGQASMGYLKKYIKWFRKFAHLKPIENIDDKVMKLPIHLEHIEIIGLGIKDDKEFEDGTEFI
jgi:hypothetical protein